MNQVEAAAGSLRRRFVASRRDDVSLQEAVLKLRLAKLREEKRSLESDKKALERRLASLKGRAREVLRLFVSNVRLDIAMLSLAEALHQANVTTLQEVPSVAKTIRETANRLAGFDVMVMFGSTPPGGGEFAELESFDIGKLRAALVESVVAKLEAAPLSVVLKVARDLDEPEIQHEVEQYFERLQAALRRADAKWDEKLRGAGLLFLEGKVEVGEIARLLDFQPFDLAFEFERLGYHRPPERLVLSGDARDRLLTQIENWRGEGRSVRLVERDVIASQRIEGIDARADLGTGRLDDRDS
jgi:hypothetical protein